jgi:hypothetical protein
MSQEALRAVFESLPSLPQRPTENDMLIREIKGLHLTVKLLRQDVSNLREMYRPKKNNISEGSGC